MRNSDSESTAVQDARFQKQSLTNWLFLSL